VRVFIYILSTTRLLPAIIVYYRIIYYTKIIKYLCSRIMRDDQRAGQRNDQ